MELVGDFDIIRKNVAFNIFLLVANILLQPINARVMQGKAKKQTPKLTYSDKLLFQAHAKSTSECAGICMRFDSCWSFTVSVTSDSDDVTAFDCRGHEGWVGGSGAAGTVTPRASVWHLGES